MNKRVLLSTLSIAAFSCGIFGSAFASNTGDTDFSVTVNPYLNVTLSSADIHLPITPSSGGTFGETSFTASTSTNNAFGYSLNLSITDTNTASAVLTTNLKSDTRNVNDGTYPVIPTFATNDVLTSAEFSASSSTDHLNHWAISIGDSDHYQKALSEMSAVASSDGLVADDVATFYIATKLDLLTTPGSYSAYFNFEVVANPVPTTTLGDAFEDAGKTPISVGNEEYYKIQDMTPGICSASNDTEGTLRVVDVRDNNIYTIGKLADGNCWLLDNLALDLTATNASTNITSSNTNASATALGYLFGTTTRDPNTDPDGGYATAGVANGTSYSYSAPLIDTTKKDLLPTAYSGTYEPLASTVTSENWKVGVYYNYCAASAGSYCYGNGISSYGSPVDKPNTAIDAEYDICPSGWRMPTGYSYDATNRPDGGEYQTLYNAYPSISGGDNQYTRFRKALRLPLSGYFDSGSVRNRGRDGYFWSSTYYYGNFNMYYLYASTSSINPQNDGNNGSRYNEFSVRCIAK